MSEAAFEEWLKARGITCSVCGEEVYRGRDGMCLPCWRKAREFEVRDPQGLLEFLPQNIIQGITHPSGK